MPTFFVMSIFNLLAGDIMYKLFVLLILFSCDLFLSRNGTIYGPNGELLNQSTAIHVKLKIGQYTFKYEPNQKVLFSTYQYSDTILVFVNDSIFESDTIMFTWEEYQKHKLWEKDLDIYVRKKKNE